MKTVISVVIFFLVTAIFYCLWLFLTVIIVSSLKLKKAVLSNKEKICLRKKVAFVEKNNGYSRTFALRVRHERAGGFIHPLQSQSTTIRVLD